MKILNVGKNEKYSLNRNRAVFAAGCSIIEAHNCDGNISIFHPGIIEATAFS
jgi:hypothetical protein